MNIPIYTAFLIITVSMTVTGCSAPTTKQTTLNPVLVLQEEQKQKQIALRKEIDYNDRLQRVAWPILEAAVPLCEGNTVPRLGTQFRNIDTFGKNDREAAYALTRMDSQVQVWNVAPGSPAADAGVIAGDKLLRVNGKKVPRGKKAIKQSIKIANEALASGPEVSLDLIRDDQEFTVDIVGKEVCRFSAVLVNSEELSAWADGNGIYITRGMMRFADSDTELGTVVAHELAHNSQEHIKAKKKNYFLGAIFDVIAAGYGVNTQGTFGNMAAGAYSQEFEAEADYVGLYALALAGYDLVEVPDFWREFGSENPDSITRSYASSHPSSAERYLAIDNAVSEIEYKREMELDLSPEMKE